MAELLLSVDPGKRTGVSLVDFTPDTPAVLLVNEDVRGGVIGFIEWAAANVPDYLMYIVAEDFDYHGRPGADVKDPLQVLGAVHVLAHELQVPLTLQKPGGRLTAVNDDALKRLGWYTPGNPGRNMRESNRHAAIWLKNHLHRPTLALGWSETED